MPCPLHTVAGESSQAIRSNELQKPRIFLRTQEEVVDIGDVSRGAGRPVLLKQPHQVAELAMQVAEDLDGRCRR